MGNGPKVIVIPEKYFEGLDPDDTGDMWRGMKRYFADVKAGKLEQAKIWMAMESETMESNRCWTQHSEWHWSRMLGGFRLDFWPSTGRWRWRDKVHQGTLENLQGFIKKRDGNGPTTTSLP